MSPFMTRQSAKQHFQKLTTTLVQNRYNIKEKDAYLWACAGISSGDISIVELQIRSWLVQTNSPLMKIGWQQLLGIALWRQRLLPDAVELFRAALTGIVTNIWSVRPAPLIRKKNFDADLGLELLWKTLAALAKENIRAFSIAGTLLGLTREGHLLAHDKDMDIAVFTEEIRQANHVLIALGWQRTDLGYSFINFRSYYDPVSGMEIDLNGIAREKGTDMLLGGLWLEGIPWEWQRVVEFPFPLSLKRMQQRSGMVWHLANPEAWLTAVYGDWRTPDKSFDTTLSARNLRGFSLLTQCYAFSRIINCWLNADITRALSLTRQILLRHTPDDPLLKRVESCFAQENQLDS